MRKIFDSRFYVFLRLSPTFHSVSRFFSNIPTQSQYQYRLHRSSGQSQQCSAIETHPYYLDITKLSNVHNHRFLIHPRNRKKKTKKKKKKRKKEEKKGIDEILICSHGEILLSLSWILATRIWLLNKKLLASSLSLLSFVSLRLVGNAMHATVFKTTVVRYTSNKI